MAVFEEWKAAMESKARIETQYGGNKVNGNCM